MKTNNTKVNKCLSLISKHPIKRAAYYQSFSVSLMLIAVGITAPNKSYAEDSESNTLAILSYKIGNKKIEKNTLISIINKKLSLKPMTYNDFKTKETLHKASRSIVFNEEIDESKAGYLVNGFTNLSIGSYVSTINIEPYNELATKDKTFADNVASSEKKKAARKNNNPIILASNLIIDNATNNFIEAKLNVKHVGYKINTPTEVSRTN